MNHQINSYLAILVVTLIGASLSLVIIRAANNNTFQIMYSGSLYDTSAYASTTSQHS